MMREMMPFWRTHIKNFVSIKNEITSVAVLCVAGQNHRDEGQRRRRNDEDDDNDEESHVVVVVVVGLCVFGDVSSRSRRAGCAAPSRDRRVSRLSRQRCIERVGCHDKRKLRPSREKRRDASIFRTRV